MTVINTNISANIARDAIGRNDRAMATSMERLSTGLRINSAKDDAAGLAIANRMAGQISGLNMAAAQRQRRYVHGTNNRRRTQRNSALCSCACANSPFNLLLAHTPNRPSALNLNSGSRKRDHTNSSKYSVEWQCADDEC